MHTKASSNEFLTKQDSLNNKNKSMHKINAQFSSKAHKG